MLMFPGRIQHLHDDFARVWDNLAVATLIGTQNPDIELSKTPLARIIEQRIAGKRMLDYLPLLSELCTDLQRVNINSGGGGIPYQHTFKKFEPEGRRPDELFRLDASGCVVHSNTGANAEAEGWSFKIDET
jgi:hypothetical protein